MARSFDAKLAALRSDPSEADLRAALSSNNGILVAAAAKHATAAHAPALAEAFRSLLVQGAKRDPGCRGKTAVVRALHDLEVWDDVIATGLRVVQKEGSYGPPVDTAAELRGLCGLCHAHLMRADVLDVLPALLADPEVPARVGAAQAIGDAGRPDASALLRFKILQGDSHPEVVAACCEALLHLQREAAIEFVAGLLVREGHEADAEVAALALAGSRLPEALPPLRAWVERCMPAVRRSVGYVALALTRGAHDDLIAIVREGDREDVLAAAKALATFKDDEALSTRVLDASPKALRREIAELFER